MLPQSEQQKILNILKYLPPEKLDEVIEFAKYLKAKEAAHEKKKHRPSTIPTFHLGHVEKDAFNRNTLYGEYLDRKFD